MAYEYVVLDGEAVAYSAFGWWVAIPVWWEDIGAFGEVLVDTDDGATSVSADDPRPETFGQWPLPPVRVPRNWKRIVGVA